MNKHTPGPYVAVAATKTAPGFRYDKDYGIYTEDGKLIAEVYQQISIHEHIDASHNANLFAAAPDLLDACQSLVKWWDDEGNFASVDAHIWAFDKARAAIAKAKGEAVEVPA